MRIMTGVSKHRSKTKLFFQIAWWVTLPILVSCESHEHKSHDGELDQVYEFTEQTENGSFMVHLSTADKSPAPIGEYHDWSITLTDRDSVPVQTASIAVTGGMPAHGHGLPTKPEVSQNLGNGHYLVEGILFTMSGEGLLRINIVAEGKSDVVDFTFSVSS